MKRTTRCFAREPDIVPLPLPPSNGGSYKFNSTDNLAPTQLLVIPRVATPQTASKAESRLLALLHSHSSCLDHGHAFLCLSQKAALSVRIGSIASRSRRSSGPFEVSVRGCGGWLNRPLLLCAHHMQRLGQATHAWG
jgi:hypothetical protein